MSDTTVRIEYKANTENMRTKDGMQPPVERTSHDY